MGLMQWDATQQARELHYILGVYVLCTRFKCHCCKVLETQFEMQLNWDVGLLSVTLMERVVRLWLKKSPTWENQSNK